MVRCRHCNDVTMENTDLPKIDHDILITLVETVKNNHTALLDKIAGVKEDVSDIKETVNLRIADHELRIKALEKLRDEVQPQSVLEIVKKNDKWINDFKITWKTVLVITAGASAVITFLLTTLIHINNLFGGK